MAEFIEFWLKVCLDQVRFMGQMLALDSLQERFVGLAVQVLYDYGRGPLLHHRSKLRPGLPFFSLKYLFPGLWPEAEGVMTPPPSAAIE
ncbi:MAG: hypothetical protein A2V79_02885 [Betaproteobacteria bacterium RBG_16_56_24]|nr:MAG: hypothetical protein A2V79_02885 [Betaproteobacteria bacterium RBG_16_56_24]